MFLTKVNLGGFLGFYCRYPYFHTSPNAKKTMPDALKGLDLVLHNVFSSLGLKVEVRPILDPFKLEEMEKHHYDVDIDRYEDEHDRCACCTNYPVFPSFKDWKAQRPEGDLIGTEFRELKFCSSDEDATWLRMKESVSTSVVSFEELRLINGSFRICRKAGTGIDTEI